MESALDNGGGHGSGPNSASPASSSSSPLSIKIGTGGRSVTPMIDLNAVQLDPSAAAQSLNIVSFWVQHRLFSHDRVERHFAFLVGMLVASTVLFSLLKTQGPVLMWGSPFCTLWAAGLIVTTLGNVWAEQRERWGLFELTRLVQFLMCMLSVLVYYDGSNVINRYRYAERGDAMLYDETLLRMDEAIWGWLWPKGQMALWLDTQMSFGVTTPFGRMYAELFQILYVSYYFWGNFIGIILAWRYFWYCVYKKNKGTNKRVQWRRIQMFVSAWVGAFVLNHLINLCFPAVSPRIYLKEHYKNELKGLWVLAGMRNAITNAAANTFSAFPSGHCGLSILAVLLAFRIHLSSRYTAAVATSTVLIVLATQVLRYHYFVDFLFSGTVVAFGAWLGGFHDEDLYNRSLTKLGLEEHDEEGKPCGSPMGYESVPLNGGGRGEGGAASPSPRAAASSSSSGGGGDIEMGAGGAFGSMTRSISSQRIDKDLSHNDEEV